MDYTLSRFDVPFAGTSLGNVEFMQNYGHTPGNPLRVDLFWNASETAGKMSSFSSWGPTEGLTLKPEITGIGGQPSSPPTVAVNLLSCLVPPWPLPLWRRLLPWCVSI